MKRLIIPCLSLWLLSACQQQRAAESSDGSARLHALFDREWERDMREDPVRASQLGDRRYNDQWEDLSLDAIEQRHRKDVAVLEELKRFDPAQLHAEDRLNLLLFRRQYERGIEAHPYRWYLLPLDHRWGIQTANTLGDQLRFETIKDYEDWIARLNGFGGQMDQTIALMKEGIRTGMVHSRVVMERVPKQIEAQIVDDPSKSPFFAPFERMPGGFDEATKGRLSDAGRAAIAQQVIPAYRRFHQFFTREYLPACYEKVGAWQMPRGREMYAMFARHFTTTDLTPRQIHQIGLDEVRRIRAEMHEVMQRVGFTGSFEQFLDHLRTDERYYYKTGQELLDGYRALSKKIDPQLVKLFRTMPRMPYGVEAIPDIQAPDTTTAYYRPPAADGSRAGSYFVNLHRPETRPKYEMEALSLHEAVPGHHFQIALAMEQQNLPRFRRHSRFTAYVEGWALYCETLGEELGLYTDPYQKFGQLTYEMWRACRLVVDTGMHELSWTRQQAIDFIKANAAKSELDIVNEVDRYIAWPGQALAYKIGQIKITELRRKAEQTLGDKFDIRGFHDVVLLTGAVPLDVLEQAVDEWIASRR